MCVVAICQRLFKRIYEYGYGSIDVEDRELLEDVESDAGLFAESVRRLNGGRYRDGEGRQVRLPAGVKNARVHHSEIV